MNNDLNRLEKIKKDRIELLKQVKDSIKDNHYKLDKNISYLNRVIDLDDFSMNRLDVLTKSQELIAELTTEVVNASTPEEVAALRKKLNYLINKIKKEINSRNLSDDKKENYKNKVSYLRKDISAYIRYLKRENNISKIEELMSNYENLNSDELKSLKKLLKNEVSYNTRNLKKEEFNMDEYLRKGLNEVKIEEPKEEKKKEINFDNVFVENRKKEEKEINYDMVFSDTNNIINIFKPNITIDSKEELLDYFRRRFHTFDAQYGIEKTYEYGKSSISNIGTLLRNIPLYIHNRRKLKYMKDDFVNFYNGNDFKGYIDYIKKRNSILNGLKYIFSKTYLKSNEGRYLNIHNKCSKWLYNYCEANNLSMPQLHRVMR